MKYMILLGIIFIPFLIYSQEQWSTLNISGQINKHWSVAMEGEQRYNYDKEVVRYFHYDIGLIRKINNKLKIGLFYREIYEIKKGIRVIEHRPHIDAFYQANQHWKFRTRLEYQFKEIDPDVLRFRIRPNYDFKWFKNGDPYIQTELNFTEKGFTRNRFNAGVTINLGKFQIQPGYLLESLYNNGQFTNINVMWVNSKISF
jgi:hypothetical protein